MRKVEYMELLKPIVLEYEKFPYSFWSSRIDETTCLQVASATGAVYDVGIEAFWDDKPNAAICVSIALYGSGWRSFFPVCDTLLVAEDS